jgi:hypothetical protein
MKDVLCQNIKNESEYWSIDEPVGKAILISLLNFYIVISDLNFQGSNNNSGYKYK